MQRRAYAISASRNKAASGHADMLMQVMLGRVRKRWDSERVENWGPSVWERLGGYGLERRKGGGVPMQTTVPLSWSFTPPCRTPSFPTALAINADSSGS